MDVESQVESATSGAGHERLRQRLGRGQVKLDAAAHSRTRGTFGGLAFGEQILESVLEVVNLGLRFVAIEGREAIVDTTAICEFAL